MPFGKHLYSKSAGFGLSILELVPAEMPDPDGVTDEEVERTVRSIAENGCQGDFQAFQRCVGSARRRWVAVSSDGHPTGPREASQLEEEDIRDVGLAASLNPTVARRAGMVAACLKDMGWEG